MGWEPKGSAASTGVHHFCQVWPWPRPEHTTEMAQDVGAGRRARLRERREKRKERTGQRRDQGDSGVVSCSVMFASL